MKKIISLNRRDQDYPKTEGTKQLADTSVLDTLHVSRGLVL